MRPNVLVWLIGAFGGFWVFYQLDELGVLIPAAAVAILIAVGWLASKGRAQGTQRKVAIVPTPHVKAAARTIGNTEVGYEDMGIEKALDNLPASLLSRSGSVFYSGREAFSGESQLYLLGLNPGGDPSAQSANTVAKHIREFRERGRPWSAYADDRWEGAAAGAWGMQPRVLHMLSKLGMNPQVTPAANVIFVRSKDEAALRAEKALLIRACWPVHEAVLQATRSRVIVCFGATAGSWVREQLRATNLIDQFVEANNRGWKSQAHQAPDGRIVVTTSHPGRVDWRNPAADPTPLVQRALLAAG